MRRQRKGFTLIELLVVIAIIGILAAMVFPVFARARESARKAVCLSNLKNIGLAIQMYLADNNDTFSPSEHRQEAFDFFWTAPGGAADRWPGPCHDEDDDAAIVDRTWWYADMANPYLTWPVVLDEYVKNREVWQCPSAKMMAGAMFILPGPNWLGYLSDNMGSWGGEDYPGPCLQATFPPGWGGEVTDSVMQGRPAVLGAQWGGGEGAANKAFIQTIGTQEQVLWNQKILQYNDVAHLVVAADGGANRNFFGVANLAYPDICCPECAGVAMYAWGWPDASCPDGTYCPECSALHATVRFAQDNPSDQWQKDVPRHLGGVNIAWGDGHVTWMNSRAVCSAYENGDIEGTGYICSGTAYENYVANCGTPPAGMSFLFNKGGGWTTNW